eukprot:CAMPEP_0179421390 /NCGR_PEP_ID=MMETSP0799-20121207/9748_1 /TAXON_ID=46947 /ORGANISM="Geminigera cryophila, Strain CCMP2564" /LENGTH=43 /DNA_ID= /DNA_START= /DNA_END= /DNA_ORIENTATION=
MARNAVFEVTAARSWVSWPTNAARDGLLTAICANVAPRPSTFK